MRSLRGGRHPLPANLALATAAMLSGARSLYAIAQWGRLQDASAVRALGFTWEATPAVTSLPEVFGWLVAAAIAGGVDVVQLREPDLARPTSTGGRRCWSTTRRGWPSSWGSASTSPSAASPRPRPDVGSRRTASSAAPSTPRAAVDGVLEEMEEERMRTEQDGATGRERVAIVANGKPVEVPRGATVGGFLAGRGLTAGMAIVECNGEIVPRVAYGATVLSPGDRLEVMHAAGGG